MTTQTNAADGRTVGPESFAAVSKLLTKTEVASLLRVGPIWLMKAVDRGDVPGPLLYTSFGPRWSPVALQRWIQGATANAQ